MAGSSTRDSIDPLASRLSGIERLLATDPAQADAEAAKLLLEVPGHAMTLLFQGIARRLMGSPRGAIDVLEPLCQRVKDAPLPHLQLGLALQETGHIESAAEAMRRAVTVKPDFPDAWLALAEALITLADKPAADRAFMEYIRHSQGDPRLTEPEALIRDNRAAEAESLLRKHLDRHPNDVRALCLLADIATRHGRFDVAETLLAACLDLVPSYAAARHNHALVLMRQNRPDAALVEADRLIADEPDNSDLQNMRAAIFLHLLKFDEAIAVYEQILEKHPGQMRVWANLGHALRTVGRLEPCVDAYRHAIALAPEFGEAYWNLANLKTFRLTDDELETMRRQLRKPDLRQEDRVHFSFAIGKALEDRESYAESFRHYTDGNRLRREKIGYDADAVSEHVRRSKEIYTPAFLAERSGYGASAAGPIFVVGLPRSGSTLVDQILASHSAVEGTMELPHVMDIAKSLSERAAGQGEPAYPGILDKMDEHEFRELGLHYIEQTRPQRKGATRFFLDKMPNNFAHAGLIHLILPHARIIDIRRHPMACGLSLFKHLFANGQPFSYSLDDIGRFYSDYVDLMAHFDAVLPGRIHRVIYESLVENTEAEVRRMLAFCELPFEEGCLNFFSNQRAVSTASSEQVRLPIFRDALEHWRHYEPWLQPLKAALGPCLDSWAQVPAPR